MIPPRAGRARLPATPPQAVSVELEIPFGDVDLLGVAWYGNYPRYVDLARTALLRARDLDNDELERHGVVFVVSETFLHHASPLRYADRARVSAWFLEVENRLRIAFRIRNLTRDALAAEGWLVLVAVRANGELCLEVPPAYVARLRAPGPGTAAGVEEPAR